MTKKILAALAAAVLCAGTASCGQMQEPLRSAEIAATEVSDPGETSETTAWKPLPDVTAEGVKAAEVPTKKSTPIITENSVTFDDTICRLVHDNLLLIYEGDKVSEPSDEEISAALDAVLAQYRAAEGQDLEAFLATFRFDDLACATADLMMELSALNPNESKYDYMEQKGQKTKYQIIRNISMLVESLMNESYLEQLQQLAAETDLSDAEAVNSLYQQAYASITAGDVQNLKDAVEQRTIFDSEDPVPPIEGISDDSVYILWIDQCSHEQQPGDSALYMKGSLMIETAETEYSLNDILIWKTGSQCGTMIDSDLVSQNADPEIRGLTAKEMLEMMKDEVQEHYAS